MRDDEMGAIKISTKNLTTSKNRNNIKIMLDDGDKL